MKITSLCLFVVLYCLLAELPTSFASKHSITIPTKKIQLQNEESLKKRSEDSSWLDQSFWAAEIGIGTPTQTFTLLLDTGSPGVSVQ
jgi:hypothetical protein